MGVASRAGVKKTNLARRSFNRPLSYLARNFPGGKFALMEALRDGRSDDPKIKQMVERWFALSKSDRRYVSLDELADSGGLDYRSAISAFAAALPAKEAKQMLTNIVRIPEHTEACIALALGQGREAQRARLALLQQAGIFKVHPRTPDDD